MQVVNLALIDLAVRCYLDKAVLVLLNSVERRNGLKDDQRQIFDLDLRNMLLADRALIRTVVVAERSTNCGFSLFTIDSMEPGAGEAPIRIDFHPFIMNSSKRICNGTSCSS